MSELENNLKMLIEEFKSGLPVGIYESLWVLADHNEGGIAIEDLCSNIDEWNLHVSRSQLETIRNICEAYGIDPSWWETLQVNNDNNPIL